MGHLQPTSMEEQELLEDIRSGKPGAFEILVERHQEAVLSTCYRFLNNREDAEDIAQDVFVEVYLSISRFRGDAKLSTWIYRIAVTKSLDLIRKRKRKKRFAQIQYLFGNKEEEEELPLSNHDNPEKELEDQERAAILQGAVESLPESQRIAIVLNKYEGFSYREVADIMETTLSSVESLIHRAKKNLEKYLYNYYEDVL